MSVYFFCRLNLLFYINPQLYGFSAITKVLLRNVHLKCEFESALNCISKDGNAVLAKFEFDSVNPFEYMMVSGPFFIVQQETMPVMFNLANHAQLYTTVVIGDLPCRITPNYVVCTSCCYIKCTFLAQYFTQHSFCCQRQFFFLLTHMWYSNIIVEDNY